MLHILAGVTVNPESAAAARQSLIRLVGETRQEADCRVDELFQRADAPHEFRPSSSVSTRSGSTGT